MGEDIRSGTKSLYVRSEKDLPLGWFRVGWLFTKTEVGFGIIDLGKDPTLHDEKLDEYIEKLREQQLSIGNDDFDVIDERE